MRSFSFPVILSCFLWLVSTPGYLSSQNTVGLLSADPERAAPGYNLFFPHNQSSVFLVDNCGRLVNEWTDDEEYRPGNAVYLTEEGRLIKCKRLNASINDPIWAGGGGATVEILTWENELLHSFTLNDSLFRLHHDVAPLPNGNILMITWAKKTREEAIAAGRNPALLAEDELWSEAVLEWDPAADSIVWEWHLWDHLIQDYDARQANYGVVADHPELVDINYDTHDGHPDWLHINAIGYNPVLDQLVLSVPYFDEIWVVDHSTTTAEAASHAGGRAGRGGDLLYRWGNPATYRRGTAEDQTLFFQHDIHWSHPQAQPGDPAFGQLAVFNNRVSPDSSTANLFLPPFDADDWSYTLDDGAFGPVGFKETRFHPSGRLQAVSASVSSVQILTNGNWLICAGRWGYTYELTPDNSVVWEFITPIKNGQPAMQGDILGISDNLTFRLQRYEADFPGFAGKDLSPTGYIEENPNEGFCGGLISSADPAPAITGLQVYPNPAGDRLTVEHSTGETLTAQLLDLWGRPLRVLPLPDERTTIDLSGLPPGLYFLRLPGKTVRVVKE